MSSLIIGPGFQGFIAINKPKGPTSHDIIDQVRSITGERKVGHAGTLDPMATGVLVVAVGKKFTKQISTIVAKDKSYEATITLGATSSTQDAEGDITPSPPANIPTENQVAKVLQSLIGTIEQIPPQFSAIKIDGVRAYKHARDGNKIVMKSRSVTIHDIHLDTYRWPLLSISVDTGPGTYIRAIARDIGKALTCGGYLSVLTRTKVGDFTIKDSLDIF